MTRDENAPGGEFHSLDVRVPCHGPDADYPGRGRDGLRLGVVAVLMEWPMILLVSFGMAFLLFLIYQLEKKVDALESRVESLERKMRWQ
jgi:hypothetical protein